MRILDRTEFGSRQAGQGSTPRQQVTAVRWGLARAAAPPTGRAPDSRLPTPYSPPRNAFTLLELMVVMVVIALLAAILLPTVGMMVSSTQEKTTRATIKKIQSQIDQRMQAFEQLRDWKTVTPRVTQYKQQWLAQGVDDATALKLARIKLRKDLFRSAFPMPGEAGLPANANLSAEILYGVLTQGSVIGVPPVGDDYFTSSEVHDVDGDGLPELVDAWGNPLRFYRWPTRLVRPGGPGSGPNLAVANLIFQGMTTQTLGQDPDDPLGLLVQTTTPANFESQYHTPYTYHYPLVISAGPDGVLGLLEPNNVSGFGNLAQPTSNVLANPGDSTLNDDLTNRQAFGN